MAEDGGSDLSDWRRDKVKAADELCRYRGGADATWRNEKSQSGASDAKKAT